MTFQMIDTAETNFPVNLFTPEAETTEASDFDSLAINCCGYAFYAYLIDSIWEANIDE